MQKNNMAEGEEFMKKFTEITGAKFVDVTPKTELDLIEEIRRKMMKELYLLSDKNKLNHNQMCEITDLFIVFYHQEITKLLEGMVEEVEKKKIAGGNYNCGEEGCCNPDPDDKRELEDVDFQCGYNQAVQDFIQIIKSKI